jgi:hypothetical protein
VIGSGGGEARRVRKDRVAVGGGWRAGGRRSGSRRLGLVEEVAGAAARWRRITVMGLSRLEVRRLIHLSEGI